MSLLNRIQKFLIYILPATLFFSYHPVISLGSTDSMNLELSLPLIWLAVFFLVCLPNIPNIIKKIKIKTLIILSLVPTYLTLSCFWSNNPLRGILTSGILWLVIFAALNIFIQKDNFKAKSICKMLLIPTVIISAFCWLQSILDVLQVSRGITLLCLGCSYIAFGFPHPNGFAIEPQFMGNLLIAPALLCFYLLTFKKSQKNRLGLLATTIFITSTLFLTFSRGAIYAFSLGLALLLILQFPIKKYSTKKANQNLKTSAIVIGVACLSFILSLTAQGVFSIMSPTSDNFWTGVTKSIHQLSLGRIDLRPNIDQPDIIVDAATSTFSGYVAESTDTRVNLTNLAIKTWLSSPTNILFGVGLGSAGVSVYELFPAEIGRSKEIIQNEYASLLLESGLVGCCLILMLVVFLFKQIKLTKNQNYLFSLLFAFGLTIFFFSGLPNALHIYLLPVLLGSTKHKLFIN